MSLCGIDIIIAISLRIKQCCHFLCAECFELFLENDGIGEFPKCHNVFIRSDLEFIKNIKEYLQITSTRTVISKRKNEYTNVKYIDCIVQPLKRN